MHQDRESQAFIPSKKKKHKQNITNQQTKKQGKQGHCMKRWTLQFG